MQHRYWLSFVAALLLVCADGYLLAQQSNHIDWQRARELRSRQRRGDTLTAEEQDYLNRAKQEYRRDHPREGTSTSSAAGKPHDGAAAGSITGLIPLPELGERRYKGQMGGLYGEGRNMPTPEHARIARRMADRIMPLDAQGKPTKDGKIVLISVGMSNTKREFDTFKHYADNDPRKSASVILVNCAQGGQDAQSWAHPELRQRKDKPSPWETMDKLIREAGVTNAQVQVAWIKQARRLPQELGEFPTHARALESDLILILRKLAEKFPNLRLAYVSSRSYAGFAVSNLNPEPYAYESAFAVQWLINKQMSNDPGVDFDPQRGDVTSPLLLWGPYLWADGTSPRRNDGLVFTRSDFAEDGTHPSWSGRRKIADLLLEFFLTDSYARPWFVR
jgi:hypothetical protein